MEQWGKWCTDDIRDEIGTHTYIKLARINDDSSYKTTSNSHKITMINYIDVDKIYNNLLGYNLYNLFPEIKDNL